MEAQYYKLENVEAKEPF